MLQKVCLLLWRQTFSISGLCQTFYHFPAAQREAEEETAAICLQPKLWHTCFSLTTRCLPGNHCLFDWNFNNSLHTTCHKSPGAIHSCQGYAFIPLRPVVARWLHTSLKAFVTRAYSVDSTLSPWLSRIQNDKDGLWYCDYKSLTYDNDVKKKKIFFLTTLYLYSLHIHICTFYFLHFQNRLVTLALTYLNYCFVTASHIKPIWA